MNIFLPVFITLTGLLAFSPNFVFGDSASSEGNKLNAATGSTRFYAGRMVVSAFLQSPGDEMPDGKQLAAFLESSLMDEDVGEILNLEIKRQTERAGLHPSTVFTLWGASSLVRVDPNADSSMPFLKGIYYRLDQTIVVISSEKSNLTPVPITGWHFLITNKKGTLATETTLSPSALTTDDSVYDLLSSLRLNESDAHSLIEVLPPQVLKTGDLNGFLEPLFKGAKSPLGSLRIELHPNQTFAFLGLKRPGPMARMGAKLCEFALLPLARHL